MKILFIYPNAGSQLGFNYGLAHLSAVLKSAGHDVALLQLCEEISALPSRNAVINAVKKEDPDLVGFSVVTNQWAYTLKLAAWTREATSVPLICGGIHAMAAPEEILESGLFDYVLRGEAESALLRYKEAQGIITDFSSDAEAITAQKLAQLNAQVVEAEAKRVEFA